LHASHLTDSRQAGSGRALDNDAGRATACALNSRLQITTAAAVCYNEP